VRAAQRRERGARKTRAIIWLARTTRPVRSAPTPTAGKFPEQREPARTFPAEYATGEREDALTRARATKFVREFLIGEIKCLILWKTEL